MTDLSQPDARFAALVDSLHPSFIRLLAMNPIHGWNGQRGAAIPGIYLFSEGGTHLYVGRSNDIRGRYANHTSRSASYNSAAFAMILTRHATGRKRSYVQGPDTRKALMADEAFMQVFQKQKERIRAMDFRYVEEADPLKQTLLEVYCAVALQTPHNDFDNH